MNTNSKPNIMLINGAIINLDNVTDVSICKSDDLVVISFSGDVHREFRTTDAAAEVKRLFAAIMDDDTMFDFAERVVDPATF